MRYLLSLLLTLSFMSSAFANKILVLGDSLSAAYGISPEAGWVALMDTRIQNNFTDIEVINSSISGETTSGGLARLPILLQQHKPALVLIELGANDALRGLPLKVIERQLYALVDQSLASGAQVLLIGIRIPPNYGPRYAEGFFQLYAQVADSRNVPLVPFLLESVALNFELMLEDGIHPNETAQPILLDTVWPYLQPLLEDGL